MSMYKEMGKTIREEYKKRTDIYKDKTVKWASEPSVVRIDKPTNLQRARELGYKDIVGVVVARVRVVKGKRKRPSVGGGRKPSKSGRFYSRGKSLQAIAEERAARRFINCEVLNSYFVGDTGATAFYEVMLLDRSSPSVLARKDYVGVINRRGRSFRSLTKASPRR